MRVNYVRSQNTQETASDEELMSNYSLGDTAAFEELYHRNKAALYRYFLRQIQRAALAEEFAHDVWLRVINTRQSYLPTAKFTTYLFQIAHNRLVDHFRKSSTSNEIDCGEPFIEAVAANHADNPETAAGNTQIQRALARLIQELPPEQREVFLLKEEANLSIEEIANVISENPETVKSRVRYAVKKLKEGLQEYISR
jgi:RNA polymerase sigma-70 factor (ECF subfamily)